MRGKKILRPVRVKAPHLNPPKKTKKHQKIKKKISKKNSQKVSNKIVPSPRSVESRTVEYSPLDQWF
jgi:hypothetical protein